MAPDLDINYLAVLACVIAAMPVGWAWYGPLFGKAWAKEMGMEDMPEPKGAEMGRSMALFAVGNLLIAYVLAHVLIVSQTAAALAGETPAVWASALDNAIPMWLGFFVPIQIGRVAWEKRGWKLVAINGSFDLVRLVLFALIVAYWR